MKSDFYNRGLTLIELLVAATLMLILVLISIPAVKPMLDSNKQRQGADTLSTFLSQARLRAMETGRPCGVRFERYTDLNTGVPPNMVFPYNNACLVLRQVEVPPPYCGSSNNVGVVVNGNSGSVEFRDRTTGMVTNAEDAFWNQFVKENDLIQFDNQGPYYEITQHLCSGGTGMMVAPGPSGIPLREITTAVPFKVLRSPQPTLSAPVGFPTGIVVDLRWSGEENIEVVKYLFDINGANGVFVDGDVFAARSPKVDPVFAGEDRSHVTVMFSPGGEIAHTTWAFTSNHRSKEPLYFLIGKWERSGRDYTNGIDYLPDDKLYNFDDTTNYWVKVEPGSGKVSTFSVAPASLSGVSPTPPLSQWPEIEKNPAGKYDSASVARITDWIGYYQSTRRYGK